MTQPNSPSRIAVTDSTSLHEAIREAVAAETSLNVIGTGSRGGLGRPVEADATLDLGGLSGITLYEPDELVMTAHAATPLADILAALDDAGQILAFDPPHGGEGVAGAHGSIGGIIATNQGGPRRLVAGAARDYVLGFKAISGRGEAFQSGSRVVKNVTGYDLSKLMAGSFGTLAVMHEVTFKTMPKPETAATILYACADAENARQLLNQAFASPHEPTMAAIIPASVAVYSSTKALADFIQKGVVAAIRVEGFEISVKARSTALAGLDQQCPGVVLGPEDSDTIHADLRERTFLPPQNNRVIWKISCPPETGGRLLARLMERPNCRAYADWAGGMIWLSHPAGGDGGEAAIRAMLEETGGHATLIEAPEAMRRSLPVFPPQPQALMALTKRVKSVFDPVGVLNPGRMYEGV
ncbi:MAG: FAD-binding protein [Candidatus Puniceispirillales bacterium]